MKKVLKSSEIDENLYDIDTAACIILSLINNKINCNSLFKDNRIIEEYFFGMDSDIYYDIYIKAANKYIKKHFKNYNPDPKKKTGLNNPKI